MSTAKDFGAKGTAKVLPCSLFSAVIDRKGERKYNISRFPQTNLIAPAVARNQGEESGKIEELMSFGKLTFEMKSGEATV